MFWTFFAKKQTTSKHCLSFITRVFFLRSDGCNFCQKKMFWATIAVLHQLQITKKVVWKRPPLPTLAPDLPPFPFHRLSMCSSRSNSLHHQDLIGSFASTTAQVHDSAWLHIHIGFLGWSSFLFHSFLGFMPPTFLFFKDHELWPHKPTLFLWRCQAFHCWASLLALIDQTHQLYWPVPFILVYWLNSWHWWHQP